jgi:hypothetical protein
LKYRDTGAGGPDFEFRTGFDESVSAGHVRSLPVPSDDITKPTSVLSRGNQGKRERGRQEVRRRRKETSTVEEENKQMKAGRKEKKRRKK